MVTNRNIIKTYFPDWKLLNMQGNLFVLNRTKAEVLQELQPYISDYPSELINSKYKEQVYSQKQCYHLGGRNFEIKDSKRGNGFYLFEI